MHKTFELITALALACCLASAQAPSVSVGGVLNTASYTLDGLPDSGLAQGAMAIIYGERMGPAAGAWIPATFPLPTALAGTSVKIASPGGDVDAYMVYTSAALLKVIVPSHTPVGNASLTVTYNGAASQPVPIKVVRSAFGIFTLNQAGSGPAVITDPIYRVNMLTLSMEPGATVTVWGTGLGPGAGDESLGPVTVEPAVSAQVEVWVGGQRAEITYAGRGGGYAGLDQVNFKIPAGVHGCYVPVYIKIGDMVSNHGSISIAAPGAGACSDNFSYAEAELEKAAASGLKTANIVLARTAFSVSMPGQTIDFNSDTGSASFGAWSSVSLVQSQGLAGLSVLGTCTVHPFSGTGPAGDPVQAVPLDAGPSLQLTGPLGAKTIDLKSKGIYASVLGGGMPVPGATPAYLEPGAYTVTGTGGADVGAFTASVTIPQMLVWTNQNAITDVNRAQDLLVTWAGGAAGDAAVIMGQAFAGKPETGAVFICAERAERGTFTVPAAILGRLPASSVDTDGMSTGMLMVGSMPALHSAQFTATGIDVGYLYYSSLNAKNVNYK